MSAPLLIALQERVITKIATNVSSILFQVHSNTFNLTANEHLKWTYRPTGQAEPDGADMVYASADTMDIVFGELVDVYCFAMDSLVVRIDGTTNTTGGYPRIAGYDPQDDMLKVKSVQKKWRDSFAGASLSPLKWDSVIGAGGAVTVAGGVLTMGSGATINSESYILSKEYFTIPFRLNIGFTLSQRIVNQTFYIEAISINPTTLLPDGLHSIGLVWDGTTVTQGKYLVQNSGVTALVSGAVTFPTTASAGYYEIEPFSDETWFHGGTLDSTTGRANSYRRQQQIPEPNAVFKIRLRWLNGGTAPATNTNAICQYITVQDYAELTAEITAGRGQTVAGQGIGVNVIGTVPVSGTVTSNLGTVSPTIYTDSATPLALNATFTGTSRDLTATPTSQTFTATAFADQAGTLRLERSTDNTTWRLGASVALAIGEAKTLEMPVTTRYVRTVFVNGGVAQTAFLLTSAVQRI